MKTAVAYATDENYVKLTAVSICSLLKFNPCVDIIVLSDRISDESKSLLKETAARAGGELTLFDVSDRLSAVKSLGAGWYYSYSIYSRFFIPTILCDEADRVIYLDCDTLIMGQINPLFDLDLEGRPFAIGYDCICNRYKKIIGLHPDAPYFNTGVLVMDLAEWQRQHCLERLTAFIKNATGRFILPDQDYVAHALGDYAAILPPQYNFLTHFQMFKRQKDALRATGIPACAWYGEEQYAAAQKHPIIHHFLGNTLGRPWYRESLNPLRETYRRLAAEAGVPEVAEQSRPVEFHYRLQHLCWRCLPQPLFAIAVRAMYSYFFRTRYGV